MRRLLFLAIPVLIGAASPPFEARGSGPKWSMAIAENRISFVLPGSRPRDAQDGQIDTVARSPGRVLIVATMDEPQFVPVGRGRNGRPVYYIESVEWPLSIEVTEGHCTDSRRRSFPSRVVLSYGGSEIRGCGGTLAALEAGLAVKP